MSSRAQMDLFAGDEILKPHAAPRKRPLRTYGRRAQLLPDRDAEPPRKKRALNEDNSTNDAEIPARSCPPSSPQLPALTPNLTAPAPAERGSILAFFRPIAARSSSSAVDSEQHISSDVPGDGILQSSPPSSPPLLPQPARVKRRLTTRMDLLGSPVKRDPQEITEAVSRETAECAGSDGRMDTADSRSVMSQTSPQLRDLDHNLLNPASTSDGGLVADGFKVKHEAKRRTRKPTVQTTLNLRMANDPAFTICKDCDMLYNPLNEKDRKDHATQHAAAMRRKGRQTVQG